MSQRKASLLEAAIDRTTATHAGVALAVQASAGTALLLPLDQPADVLERADRAMYERKADPAPALVVRIPKFVSRRRFVPVPGLTYGQQPGVISPS